MPDWRRHFFYRTECVRTTWKLRLGVLVALVLGLVVTWDFWVAQIGRSLVCARDVGPSDVILIENFDPEYLLFERAEALQRAGVAPRVLVPVQVSREPGVPNPVSKGIAEVMARQARITTWNTALIGEREPITLNAAYELRDYFTRQQVKSVLLVTSGFRSRRSALIYRAAFDKAGIHLRCDPVIGPGAAERWTASWHGIQTVSEEFLKLQYYRFWVIPFFSERIGPIRDG